MTVEQFRNTLHLQPFHPFTVRMVDGMSYDIPHPDFVALAPTGRTVIVYHADDSYSIWDLELMNELQVSANGKK